MEEALPTMSTSRAQKIEEAANQLSCYVNFLDRRLSELAPQDWKAQIGTAT